MSKPEPASWLRLPAAPAWTASAPAHSAQDLQKRQPQAWRQQEHGAFRTPSWKGNRDKGKGKGPPSACRVSSRYYASCRPLVSGIPSHNAAAMMKKIDVIVNAAPYPRDWTIVPTRNGAIALSSRPLL